MLSLPKRSTHHTLRTRCVAIPITTTGLRLLSAAQVEMIVSGDDDRLVLGSFAGIPIVNTAEALRRVDGSSARTRRDPRFSLVTVIAVRHQLEDDSH